MESVGAVSEPPRCAVPLQWVRVEVADGLQALLSLRLKNTPAEDMIELTADIWVAALGRRVSVEQLDAHRIREGFQRLFPKVREWPAPIQVIELMPPRKPVPAISYEISREQRHVNKQRLRDLAQMMTKGD